MPTPTLPTIGSGYNASIGTRVSPVDNKTVEYFNTQNNQGFSNPDALSTFVNQNFAGSNANAQNVFSLLGGNYTNNTITPEKLAPAAPVNYQQPTPSPLPDVASLYTTPPLEQTPTEKIAQQNTEDLMNLNNQEIGKSSYQQQQEDVYGVGAAQKTVGDLNAKLIGIQNDAAAIPLLLEKADSSKGVSSDIIDRQRSSLLRDNAIQALTVSSLMAAAQGQLSNAQALADKAVAAKYGPIEEKIAAAKANLDLIINSPQYSLEQKNRAQKQLDAQNKAADDIASKKADAQTIQKMAIDAASSGADSVTLDKITNASTPLEASKAIAVFSQQQTNLESIKAANVATRFANSGGEIQDSKTGYAYTSEQDFLQKTGMTVAQAQAKGLITPIAATSALKAGDTQIVTANGRSLLVNKITGAIIKDLGSAYKDGNGSGDGKPTVEDDISSMSTQLESVAGDDGYVAPADYKKALKAWQSAGRSAASFKTNFQNYINPADPQDYK